MPDDIRNPKLGDVPASESALPTMPPAAGSPDLAPLTGGRQLAPSLRIMLDEKLYEQVKRLASIMSNDAVFTPKHLQGKSAACFTVITQAVNWNLDPNFVARGTYETPGGSIGFEGKLVQAILEQSGRFLGSPKFKYVGDWSKITGKFIKATSQRGKEYAKPTWTEEDAEGLGIIVSWQVKGEPEPRTWPGDDEPFYLTQCYPLNSPLWATDPKTQISYLAMRRFANGVAAGIFGGMPFDHEELLDAAERARDVTPAQEAAPPRPQRSQFFADPVTQADPKPQPEPVEVADVTGEYVEYPTLEGAVEAYRAALDEAEKQRGEAGLTAIWEGNTPLMNALLERGQADLHKQLSEEYGLRRQAAAEKGTTRKQDVAQTDTSAATAVPPRSPIWKEASYRIEAGKLLDGSSNTARLRDDLLFLVEEAETTIELDKLGDDNSGYYDMLPTADRADLAAAFEQRRQEIAK